MHDIAIREFEDHLNGEASRAFHDHLEICAECRTEVAAMSEVSNLLRTMRAPGATAQPPLGFYNRLTDRIIEDQRRSVWGLFAPSAVFFRRVAFASLLLLAGMGSFLVSRERAQNGADAVSIIAQHDVTAAHSESDDRDRVLVSLATYRE